MPHHPTTEIVIGGKPINVDAGIAADISAINSRGLTTLFSCQGDDGTPDSPVSCAYVGFAAVPTGQLAPVFAAARAAGLEILEGCIYADPRDYYRAKCQAPTTTERRTWNSAFRHFLRDLGAGDLDGSGDRYRTHGTSTSALTTTTGVDTVLAPADETLASAGQDVAPPLRGRPQNR